MATLALISDALVQESIIRAVQNVCRTMLRHEASFVEKSPDAAYAGFNEQPHIICAVGFVGNVNGLVYLCIPESFANQAASHILGMTTAEIQMIGDGIVKDVVGEITNMTVGGFKNALCDVGFPCKLTLPTIIRGEKLSVAALKSATRHTFHFDCDHHRLVADIQLKED